MDAMLRAGEVVKYAYLDWDGEKYWIHIETWVPGRKPLDTFVPTYSTEQARELLRSYRRLGYLSGE